MNDQLLKTEKLKQQQLNRQEKIDIAIVACGVVLSLGVAAFASLQLRQVSSAVPRAVIKSEADIDCVQRSINSHLASIDYSTVQPVSQKDLDRMIKSCEAEREKKEDETKSGGVNKELRQENIAEFTADEAVRTTSVTKVETRKRIVDRDTIYVVFIAMALLLAVFGLWLIASTIRSKK